MGLDTLHIKGKTAAGVEVRIIFDDFGSIARQNRSFVKKELRSDGIKVIAFNRIRASVDLFLNNRDHRKICVIDGYVSMTGGLNIADEYINLYPSSRVLDGLGCHNEGRGIHHLCRCILRDVEQRQP